MTAYYTTLGDLTDPNTDGVFCADDIAAYEQAVGNDPSQSSAGDEPLHPWLEISPIISGRE